MSRARFIELQQEAARRQRDAEDQVLDAAGRLRDDDGSLTARQIRATAESIRDHRDARR